MTGERMTVLLLCGGPDAERDVSIDGATEVEKAIRSAGKFDVNRRVIDKPTLEELRGYTGDVVFPLVHGRWGEGGPLQDLLELDGRPFIGCGSSAARLAMDKFASKSIAAECGINTAPSAALRRDDARCPLPLPVVLKPAFEGSTIGLHVCCTEDEWRLGRAAALATGLVYMIEPFIHGRELTVSIVGNKSLPIIEILPAEGLYDYDAKYKRDDTRYLIAPNLPSSAQSRLHRDSLRLARRLGCASLARVDWLMDDAGDVWMLEINTMPGFTAHSLVPMAAASEGGGARDLGALCADLITGAQRAADIKV